MKTPTVQGHGRWHGRGLNEDTDRAEPRSVARRGLNKTPTVQSHGRWHVVGGTSVTLLSSRTRDFEDRQDDELGWAAFGRVGVCGADVFGGAAAECVAAGVGGGGAAGLVGGPAVYAGLAGCAAGGGRCVAAVGGLGVV